MTTGRIVMALGLGATKSHGERGDWQPTVIGKCPNGKGEITYCSPAKCIRCIESGGPDKKRTKKS